MENINQTENATINEAPKRPQFLTVTCILSFIAAGIAIIGLVIGIIGLMAMQNAGIDMTERMSAAGGEQAAAAMAIISLPSLSISLILSIVALFGAIMMWKLNKKGFYVYTGAQVLGIIIPIAIAGMAAFSIMSFVFTALFITLYALNLKHMR